MPKTTVARVGLRRDLLRYGGAIFGAAGLSVVQVFLIPRQLDVPTYGHYRLFLTFVSQIGVLHFGLADGAFLRWAGESPGLIAREWRRVVRWLLAIELALVVAVSSLAAFSGPLVRTFLIAIVVCALFANVVALCCYALQAAGDFRRAGRVMITAPILFVAGLFVFSSHVLTQVLALYIASFAISAIYGASCILRIRREAEAPASPLKLGTLVGAGLPVLGASYAAVLAQSVDRLLVSVASPITDFALYGFASTAGVAANSATQAVSRVALSHAARRPVEDRARFLGEFFYLIAAGFGAALVAEPLFEHVVARTLPLYGSALPIVRSLTLGLPFWVGIHVVIVCTLQSCALVRRQLVVELIGVAFVALTVGASLYAGVPLWSVAGAVSLAGALTLASGTVVVRRSLPHAPAQPVVAFTGTVIVQGAALLIALFTTDRWIMQTMIYAALAAAPTIWSARRAARAHL
ncbi:MAG: hypothetical protein V4550_11735 [Gemmatimonadota bacterium]